MRLYHRTGRDAADQITATRTWISKEYDGRIFFSTSVGAGNSEGYGEVVLAVEVPDQLTMLDDEFPDGEQHFSVYARHLAGLPVTEVATG
jgi:hypothetical protein